ncbi:SH3 domain-containing protein [Chryseobacterium gossypii]|uniref:SH3 domain-containing protein n=1 Tax=Chryseobacterium gossypii TaxID=3231602 RepID=UPI0035269C89
MKAFISVFIIYFSFFTSGSFSPKPEKSFHHGGRCTGSAYCTACSNCSGCGHCAGGGGTCGVCKNGYAGKSTSGYSSKKGRFKSKKNTAAKAPSVFVNEININSPKKYITDIASTKVYEKPSLKSKVIATVPKKTKLIYLSKQSLWYKVQIKKTGKTEKTGYVYYKDILKTK